MKITFRPPLDRMAGSEQELDISHPVSLAEVLGLLKEKIPALSPYAAFSRGEKQAYGLLAWRHRKVLALDDIVLPTDVIEIIVMAAGG